MAYDLDEDYDENVTKLIVKSQEKFIKSPRYQSIHKKRTTNEITRAKSAHKTLGLPKVQLNPPTDYLKKGSRIKPEAPRVNHKHYHRPGYIKKLPEWQPIKIRAVSACQLPRDPVETARMDFRKRNIENAKNSRSKSIEPKSVDTRKGDVQALKPSGLMPNYIFKKNFGQVPSYLKTNLSGQPLCKKSELSNVHISGDKRDNNKPACRYITEDERAKLLESMKKKWAEMMKSFQCLPFIIDTNPKVKRKTALEVKLKQLEKDIELIENHQYIYVYDNENNNY